jgi:hypothetical protein
MSRVQKEDGMDDPSRVAAVREVWLPGLRHHGGNFHGTRQPLTQWFQGKSFYRLLQQ